MQQNAPDALGELSRVATLRPSTESRPWSTIPDIFGIQPKPRCRPRPQVAPARTILSKVSNRYKRIPAVAERLEADAAKHWNTFYQQNQTNFFKDRHYLQREFPDLIRPDCVMLEVGALQVLLPGSTASASVVTVTSAMCDFYMILSA